MGWSLDYKSPQNIELLDQFFLTAGKSLYLASSFESKCQWILFIMKITEHFERKRDTTASMKLAKTLKNKLLGPTLNELKEFPDFTYDDITKLERAKNARNFIVHESTNIGPLSSTPTVVIREKLNQLRNELNALIPGDNLVSSWIYEITEKEPSPSGIKAEYPTMISEWIFGTDENI